MCARRCFFWTYSQQDGVRQVATFRLVLLYHLPTVAAFNVVEFIGPPHRYISAVAESMVESITMSDRDRYAVVAFTVEF